MKPLNEFKLKNKFFLFALIIILFFLSAFNIQEKKWHGWTGFGADSTLIVTKEMDHSGYLTKVINTIRPEPSKTFWDILNLSGTLAIPFVLFYLSSEVQKQQQKSNEETICEGVLQKYIDDISKLILENNLNNDNKDNPARDIATAKTSTVLRRLDSDAERRLDILIFLYDANLISSTQKVNLKDCNFSGIKMLDINLKEADLSGINLEKANFIGGNLEKANFTGANLVGINLSGATLKETSFENTKLRGAILECADIKGANFKEANVYQIKLEGVKNKSEGQLEEAINDLEVTEYSPSAHFF
jgi:uncharacterized protein YjbI with pentapeptide repeats